MTHTEQATIHPGRTGAKRQSWREKNPRSVLLKLIAEHPHETQQDEDNIVDLLWNTVRKDDDLLKTICLYWATNNYRSIVYAQKNSTVSARDVATAKANIVRRLLDFMMPNGKLLRDCTASECKRAGGWLAKIGRQLKPGLTVGQQFNEKTLKAMLAKALPK